MAYGSGINLLPLSHLRTVRGVYSLCTSQLLLIIFIYFSNPLKKFQHIDEDLMKEVLNNLPSNVFVVGLLQGQNNSFFFL